MQVLRPLVRISPSPKKIVVNHYHLTLLPLLFSPSEAQEVTMPVHLVCPFVYNTKSPSILTFIGQTEPKILRLVFLTLTVLVRVGDPSLEVGEGSADAAVSGAGPGEAGGLGARGLGRAQQLHDREVQRGEVLLRAQRQRGGSGEQTSECRVSRSVNTKLLVNLRIRIASFSWL